MVKGTFQSYTASAAVLCLAVALLLSFEVRSSGFEGHAISTALDGALEPMDPLPPMITTEPQSQIVASGTSVTFSVVASGTGPLSYLWQWNGTNIADATNDTFSISNTLPSHTGSYQVIVTDAGLSITSMVASLTVLVPPGLTTDPDVFVLIFSTGVPIWVSRSPIMEESLVRFQINASGTKPLFYQWQFNGTDIDGATNSYYFINDISTNQGGGYRVIVSNAVGSVTSAVATVVVRAFTRILTNAEALGFTNGAFGLRVAEITHPPMYFVVEASSNLVDWFGIYTNYSASSFLSFADFDASNHPQRFYRGVGRDPLFKYGLTTKGRIDFNSDNLRIDSFDSNDPNTTTDGHYDLAKARDHGNVATQSTITNLLNIGNSKIYGRVSTGPHAAVFINTNGSVGDMAWHAAGNLGIEPGFVTDDMNALFPDVTVPFANGGYLTAPSARSQTINGVTYSQVFNSGAFKLTNITLSAKSKVLINGDVSIWLQEDFSMTGQSQVDFATGARLAIYAGFVCHIGGNGFRNNGDASSCIIYGLPGCTQISVSGSGFFTGCIYARNADLMMSGGTTAPYEFAGATITKSATLVGYLNFHYDENLQRVGPIH
jgi:hypothetical protein